MCSLENVRRRSRSADLHSIFHYDMEKASVPDPRAPFSTFNTGADN